PGCASPLADPKSGLVVRKGYFLRSSDHRRIQRFLCLGCGRTFSNAVRTDCYRQKKRALNEEIFRLLNSTMSERRVAIHLGISRRTVSRKSQFLSARSVRHNEAVFRKALHSGARIASIQFDEMETFERSKLLPLSIPLIIEPNSRKILAIGVARMPATGLLAEKSRRKYGRRRDERAQAAARLFRNLSPLLSPKVQILTDQKPQYPVWIQRQLPKANHDTTPGRRGCVVGQGELKRGGFDPLFSLNHTAALLRENVNRLLRRTWCTTKKPERLEGHLQRY